MVETKLIPVTVVVFTLNEEINLPYCLDSVKFTDDVVVVDSFSSDRTLEIAKNCGARVFQNEFKGFGTQRNWALENVNPRYDWILILDADERVSAELAGELSKIFPDLPDSVVAFRIKRRFYMWGKWLKYSSLYPTYVVRLIRKGKVTYENRGHAETQNVAGEVRETQYDLIDENRKGLRAWFERQVNYTYEDAVHEVQAVDKDSKWYLIFSSDPLQRRASMKRLSRVLPFRPLWYFFYSYVWRMGFLDGCAGFMFCYMRSVYQAMVIINKYDYMHANRER